VAGSPTYNKVRGLCRKRGVLTGWRISRGWSRHFRETVAGSPTYNNLRGLCRKRGVLTEENIAWLEQVFRENVGKGKEEFTLDEFKKIVPSKNVSRKLFTSC
jgi:hypothetical protein